MTMTELKGDFPSYGKALMQELEWENIKCEDCDRELEPYEANEYGQVKSCPECGKKYLWVKRR